VATSIEIVPQGPSDGDDFACRYDFLGLSPWNHDVDATTDLDPDFDPTLRELIDSWEPAPSDADRAWEAARRSDTGDELAGPQEPGLPLDAWVEMQAGFFRDLGSEAADLVSEVLSELAEDIRGQADGRPMTVARYRALRLEERRLAGAALYEAGLAGKAVCR
jgi:hypothetical protein